MALAIEKAREALKTGELPIASVLVLNDEVVASACTTEFRDQRFLVHAELNALLIADIKGLSLQERRSSKLYTTLEPCMMCFGACMSFFLGEVIYALESPGDGAIAMATSWSRREDDIPGYTLPKIQKGPLREESRALFEDYVASHDSGAMWEWAKTLAAL